MMLWLPETENRATEALRESAVAPRAEDSAIGPRDGPVLALGDRVGGRAGKALRYGDSTMALGDGDGAHET